MDARTLIARGGAVLGIEFGSTRIKAVLIDDSCRPIAQGSHEWENQLVDGIWSYSLQAVRSGLADCYRSLQRDVERRYGVRIHALKAMGISAMMHGYLAFDAQDRLLVPFRTWRNTITRDAAHQLTELFGYPIPQRWSVAHLYQSMLEGQEHVGHIAHLHTLASYVHFLLTGCDVVGIDDASGMFPIDPEQGDYDRRMVGQFDKLVEQAGYGWRIGQLLPKVLRAGEDAGALRKEGALLLDPSGELAPGCPLCPPEGDAATGMVATNSCAPRTGNVSAGTSAFAMVVLEKPLSKVYEDKIDLVMTPEGKPCAMSHANNCTGEYDQWIRLFGEVVEAMGHGVEKGELYARLLPLALKGNPDCGGIVPFNYISGESMTDVEEGRPLLVRPSQGGFTLANFLRAELSTALCALRSGMDILFSQESVALDRLTGHGGFFKTSGVGQRLMAAAMKSPVSVMETAGEGGAWGIALLAAYLDSPLGLQEFLDKQVFSTGKVTTVVPTREEILGFERFYERYRRALPLERQAARFVD